MLIRRELPSDTSAVGAVTDAAFRMPDADEPVEVGLLEQLRSDPGWIPELSLVAVRDIEHEKSVIGHVVCTRASLGDHPALGLGPLSVHPDHQRAGVGAALMHAVLGAADALGEAVVVLLGDPAYYSRFGFQPAADLRIRPPVAEWEPHFQARRLTSYSSALSGPFTYAEPFTRL